MNSQTSLDPAEVWQTSLMRAKHAAANGEIFTSPNQNKPYRVEITSRNNISVVRVGREENESPVTLSPTVVSSIVEMLNSKGGRCRRAELKSAYGTHNVLADLYPRIHVDVVARELVILPATLQPKEAARETSDPMVVPVLSSPEGKKLLKLHITRERNRSLVTEKKRLVRLECGTLACVVCDFDFGRRYGEHGDGFIECHHIKPLSERLREEETKIEDLAIVCANCHRMLHRGSRMLSIVELQALLRSQP